MPEGVERGVDDGTGVDGLAAGPAGTANVLSHRPSGPLELSGAVGGSAGRDEERRPGSGVLEGAGLVTRLRGRRGRGRIVPSVRSGDEGEGAFPLKGSTSDCAPQWGQRTTVVPTRSGFLDLIALEHRLHWNWVTNVSRN